MKNEINPHRLEPTRVEFEAYVQGRREQEKKFEDAHAQALDDALAQVEPESEREEYRRKLMADWYEHGCGWRRRLRWKGQGLVEGIRTRLSQFDRDRIIFLLISLVAMPVVFTMFAFLGECIRELGELKKVDGYASPVAKTEDVRSDGKYPERPECCAYALKEHPWGDYFTIERDGYFFESACYWKTRHTVAKLTPDREWERCYEVRLHINVRMPYRTNFVGVRALAPLEQYGSGYEDDAIETHDRLSKALENPEKLVNSFLAVHPFPLVHYEGEYRGADRFKLVAWQQQIDTVLQPQILAQLRLSVVNIVGRALVPDLQNFAVTTRLEFKETGQFRKPQK
ncbi:MAG: hypothetical protein HZA95_01160 [Candidatus Vogelbacteria bacterium]|nr:hypothetical protein [Candidatus Vogelbacteria bacterium]